jgi:hypothetical protein
MRKQKRKHKADVRRRITRIVLVCFLLSSFFSLAAYANEKWTGVDESVVEKYAREHGREAREPLINTDQGDMLLFVFLLGGVAGGFVAGYSWRMLMVEQRGCLQEKKIIR